VVYKEDIEQAKDRVEAWWNGEILDRAAIQVRAPKTPEDAKNSSAGSINYRENIDTSTWNQDQYREYFTNPDLVIPRLKKHLESLHFGGESFPVMYPVSIGMVAITANYLGAPLKFVSANTTWHDPIIESWDNLPSLEFDPDNQWWLASKNLLEAASASADGYFVGCPDLNGPTEILSLLRDHQRLAMDFYDTPEVIKPALEKINPAWLRYWGECTKITQQTGGYFYWMGFWSELPSIDLQSDFSCMISNEHFNEHFLPFIEEQTEMVERTIYHLDGPGAIRHADALLSLPKLTGIQWIEGAGGGSVLQYIPLLKKIQRSGKLVSAYCQKAELEQLFDELDAEGLHLIVRDCSSPEEASEILKKVELWSVK
jgi:hypothetical protein